MSSGEKVLGLHGLQTQCCQIFRFLGKKAEVLIFRGNFKFLYVPDGFHVYISVSEDRKGPQHCESSGKCKWLSGCNEVPLHHQWDGYSKETVGQALAKMWRSWNPLPVLVGGKMGQ